MEKILIAEDRYGRKNNHFEDDDFIDRLNNRWTVLALMMCIFIISGKTYVGDPINCWTPAQFSSTHNSYTNSICWLKGSYYLPTEEINIPDRTKPRVHHVSYYQWTPFILLGMSLLFLLPKYVWHSFTRRGGLNIRRLVHTIKDKHDTKDAIKLVQRTLKLHLDTRHTLHGTICCGFRCRGCYFSFTLMYFTVKILYVINTVTQFFLLNAFLSFNFAGYGVEALNRIFSGEDWFESPRFPRVTMCDFMIRHLGSNQHWYAIQCNLPINMYNEKIFFGIWVWLIVLTILNIISIIIWIVSLTNRRRLQTVKKYLKINQVPPAEREPLLSTSSHPTTTTTTTMRHAPLAVSDKDYNEFNDYMHVDGFLIFEIIANNTDDLVAGQIIEHLYTHYERRPNGFTSTV